MSAPSDLKKIALELLEKWAEFRTGPVREEEYADYKVRIEACELERQNWLDHRAEVDA